MSDAAAPQVLDPDRYLADCYGLARRIWEDGYRPDFLVALWRGGAPPGIAIQEYFRWKGHDFYHTAIRTQSLEGIRQGGEIDIRGLEHVIDVIDADHRLLIVDDLFDTGRTMSEVIDYLRRRARRNTPEIRVATVYYRVDGGDREAPDYYLIETGARPVFPHRLAAMAPDAVAREDPELHAAIWGAAPGPEPPEGA